MKGLNFAWLIFGVFTLVSTACSQTIPSEAANPALANAPPPGMTVSEGWRKSGKGVGTDRVTQGWQAFTAFRGDNDEVLEYFCGGSVISQFWILTAAHCLQDASEQPDGSWRHSEYGSLEIVIGTNNLKNMADAKTFQVAKVILHPDYVRSTETSGPKNDIALARLGGTEGWSGPVSKLSSGQGSDNDLYFGRAFFAGFGQTNPFDPTPEEFQIGSDGRTALAGSSLLTQGMIPLKSPEACSHTYDVDGYDSSQHICAGFETGGIDSCQGDSGGALVALDNSPEKRAYQIGVVSYGFRCGVPKSPGVYARVSHFKPFIKGHVPNVQFVEYEPETALSASQETLTAIIDLLQPATGRVQITINAEDAVYRRGEEFKATVSSQVSGRLWMVDIDAAGDITVLHPLPDGGTRPQHAFIEAGQSIEIGEDVRLSVRMNAPEGNGRFLAMVLPEAIELVGGSIPTVDQTKSIQQRRIDYSTRMLNQIALATGLDLNNEPDLADWGAAQVTYRIE